MMINIESLKKYIGTITEEEFTKLANNIYMITNFNCDDYPKYKKWYFTKQLPDTISCDERNILFVRNPQNKDEIISMACLKRNDKEQKICTLYVLDKYRNMGIGTKMIEESIKWLGTTKPFITLPDYKLEMFKPFIIKYNWELTEIVSNLYNNKTKEFCFNGTLTNSKKEPIERQLHNKLIKVLKNRANQIK